jgi:chemotaxis protein MotB
MRRRKKNASHANHERWLVSYADFVTLLFAFFVVLYASSQVDKRKVGMLALAIQVAFQQMGVFQASTTQVPIDSDKPMPFSIAQAIENTERTASLARISSRPRGSLATGAENGNLAMLQTELETILAPEIKEKEIAIRREPDGLVISLREVGFFRSGSAHMKSASIGVFDRIAKILRQGDYRLRIEGYTDNVPIHTAQYPSNWELSTARATEVVKLLIDRDGFDPNRLSAGGYAQYHPVASDATAEGRGMNRRVDIVVLGQAVTIPDIESAAKAQTSARAPVRGTTKTAQPLPVQSGKPTAGHALNGRLQQ